MLIMCFQIEAQSLNSRYRSHIGSNGTTYFFCPKKISPQKGIDRFVYDMTYLSSTDSVTLNFTFIAKKPDSVRSVILKNGENQIKANYLSTLYRDVLKNGYEIRTTSKFSFDEIQKVFNDELPLVFLITLNNGDIITAKYGKSQWKKETKIIPLILNSITYLQ